MSKQFLRQYAQNFHVKAEVTKATYQAKKTAIAGTQPVTVQSVQVVQQSYVPSNALQIEQERIAAERESLRIAKERIDMERKAEEELNARIRQEKEQLRLEQEEVAKEQEKLFKEKLTREQESFKVEQEKVVEGKLKIEVLKDNMKLEQEKLTQDFENSLINYKAQAKIREQQEMKIIQDRFILEKEQLKMNQEKIIKEMEDDAAKEKLEAVEKLKQSMVFKKRIEERIDKEREKVITMLSKIVSEKEQLRVEQEKVARNRETAQLEAHKFEEEIKKYTVNIVPPVSSIITQPLELSGTVTQTLTQAPELLTESTQVLGVDSVSSDFVFL